jgi:pimeloyl-ACP methyl ester carboxylesterase
MKSARYAALMFCVAGCLNGQSTVEHIKVHGKSLEGNLEGDSPDRDVIVYLPPSYAKQPNRRYPVVYFLHGYGIDAARYWDIMKVPAAADKDIAAGTASEMILVHPDAFTIYNGSMYSSSPTTGDWETFIAQDLVAWVDGHYRTIPDRMSRGLAGHSMGGYGTMRIGMKHPEVFSSHEFVLPDREPESGRAGRRAGRSFEGPRGSRKCQQPRHSGAAGGSGGVVAEPEKSTVFLRPSDQRRPASSRSGGAVGGQCAIGDDRPIHAESEEDAHAIGIEAACRIPWRRATRSWMKHSRVSTRSAHL